MVQQRNEHSKILVAFAWFFHYWFSISCIMDLWYSLDHAGRVAPNSVMNPIRSTLMVIISLGLNAYFGWKPKFESIDWHRLKICSWSMSIVTVLIIAYRYLLNDVLVKDGLIDARILFGMFVLSLGFVMMYPKPKKHRSEAVNNS